MCLFFVNSKNVKIHSPIALLNVAPAQQVPFVIPQCIQYTADCTPWTLEKLEILQVSINHYNEKCLYKANHNLKCKTNPYFTPLFK